ncbi:MAG TPA: anti-sigma factor [Bryobacteraceae bacterium]|nr:anti-sigma factor [Bryobacteraceae bacterium]
MTCEDARGLLTAYVDEELDVAHSLEVEKHLETCEACARIVESQEKVRSAIQASGLSYEPPASLDARIESTIRRSAKPAGRPPMSWPWLAAAAAILLALVLLGRLPMSRVPASDTLIAQEVLDSHLRSMMPGHLTDVESSDQHTVKPWFDGKIDFAPSVVDFAADGFPLAGGRKDSISGRTVAALVYRRNKHLINVYIWPSSAPNSAPTSAALQGYNLLHWTQGGFAWWMSSDLNAEELAQLGTHLRESASK